VVRALKLLQNGRDSCQDKWGAVTIPRGTLQDSFLYNISDIGNLYSQRIR
ncbi:hypothetical protein Tco_1519331, partial [Tanacetum coccineum]